MPLLVTGDVKKNGLVVCHEMTRLHAKPSTFSTQIKLIKYGSEINVVKDYGKWLKVHPDGFILKSAAIKSNLIKKNKNKFDNADIKEFRKKKKKNTHKRIAGTRKSFNETVEQHLLRGNTQYRYDIVDKIVMTGRVNDKVKEFRQWRKEGQLGEYNRRGKK